MSDGPYLRGLLGFDIPGSGQRRDRVVKERMHQGLYEIVKSSIDEVGIGWDTCHREDRGDGLLLVTLADSVKDLVDPLTGRIREHLDVYNRTASKYAAMGLRVGVHADYIDFVRHGDVPAVVDTAVDHVFRLVDAPVVRQLAKVGGDLTLVVSDKYFREFVAQRAGLPGRDDFQSVSVENKETRVRAWVWVSPPPRTDLPRQMSRPVRTGTRPAVDAGERAGTEWPGSGAGPEDDTPTERKIAERLPSMLDDTGPGEPDVPGGARSM